MLSPPLFQSLISAWLCSRSLPYTASLLFCFVLPPPPVTEASSFPTVLSSRDLTIPSCSIPHQSPPLFSKVSPLSPSFPLACAFATPPQLPTLETLLTKITVPLCLLYTTAVQQLCLPQPCWCPLGALCAPTATPVLPAQLRRGGLSLGRLLLSPSIISSSHGTWRQVRGLPTALSWPSTAVLMGGAALFWVPLLHPSFPERNPSPRIYLPWCSSLLLHRGSGGCSCCPCLKLSLCLVCSSPLGP